MRARSKVPAAACLPSPSCRSGGTRRSRVRPTILWSWTGLISKLLEVGFDLALIALIALFPLASSAAAFLPRSEPRHQILHETDEFEMFGWVILCQNVSTDSGYTPVHRVGASCARWRGSIKEPTPGPVCFCAVGPAKKG